MYAVSQTRFDKVRQNHCVIYPISAFSWEQPERNEGRKGFAQSGPSILGPLSSQFSTLRTAAQEAGPFVRATRTFFKRRRRPLMIDVRLRTPLV